MSLVHLVRRGEGERPPLLLLLHGYGSNEEDLFGLEAAFGPEYTIVSARGPLTMGRGSFAWFTLAFSETGPIVLKPEEAEDSRHLIIEFVTWCSGEYGTDPDRVALVGFSQGAILSAAVALTEPELVRAAVLMSGRILPESAGNAAPADRQPKYLVVHGLYDPVLPIAHGRASHATMERLGIKHDYQEFAMAHQVSDESLDLVTNWVDKAVLTD
jgi:phospholipase/carboxylesterase